MAFSAVLTGTAVSTTLTTGLNTFVLGAADAGILVGSDMVATGLPAGTKVLTIVGTTGTMTQNFTGTTGAVNVIYSSKYGSTLTISLSGATDYATPTNIVSAGFGALQGTRELYFVGGLTVTWSNIVAGAVFDFLDWTIEFGALGRWQWAQDTILGELRGGYLVNGTQFIKTVGPTFYYNQWNNGTPGGGGMFSGTGSGAVTGTFRMHNPRMAERSGSNNAAIFSCGRLNMVVENMILDYQTDSAGANAGLGAAFGTLKNTYLIKTNGSINATNGTNFANFDGINYVGNYQSTPQHKFGIPSGYTFDKYAPQTTSSQYLGGGGVNSNEYYSNIDLSSAGWGLSDLRTRYLRYAGWAYLYFSRLVSLSFKDANNNALTGVTLYIKGNDSDVVNAVQSNDYSANTIGLTLWWTASYFVYRPPEHITDNIAQIAQIRKNGYIQQTTSYSINLSPFSQPFFMLVDPAYGSVTPTQAAALTGITPSFSDNRMELSSNHTLDEMYAYGGYLLALTANSSKPVYQTSVSGAYTLTAGWVVNLVSGALSAGTYSTKLSAGTVNVLDLPTSLFDASSVWTANGLWTASMVWGNQQTFTQASMSNIGVIGNVNYTTPVNLIGLNITGNLTFNTNTPITITMTGCTVTGTISNSGTGLVTVTNNGSTFGTVGTNVTTRLSAVFTANSLLAGSTVAVYDNTGAELGLNTNSGTSYTYDATGGTGTWSWVIEYYGKIRQTGTFTPSTGATTVIASYATDLYITQTTKATVAAYTDIIDDDKTYDYAAYQRTQQPKYVFVTRSGTDVDWGNTNVIWDATASSVWSYNAGTNTVTIKSTALADGAYFKRQKTTGNMTFVNGAVINTLYVNSVGANTRFQFVNVQANSSVLLVDNTAVERLFVQNTASTSYTYYIEPGASGTWIAKVRNYLNNPSDVTFTPPGGAYFIGSDNIPDNYVVDTYANTSAYTNLETTQKVYDYFKYYSTTHTGIYDGVLFVKGFGTLTANEGWTLDPTAVAMMAMATNVTTHTTGLAEAVTLLISGAFTQGTATLSNDVQIRATNLDSELIYSGIDNITVYPTLNDAQAGTNAGAYSNNGILRFLFGAVLDGVTMSGTVYLRTQIGSVYEIQSVTLVQGHNVLDLSTTVLLQSILTQVAAVPTAVLNAPVEGTVSMVQSLRLHNAVLGGLVSGGGSGTETFRDLADTKDRLISTNDSKGNRTVEVADLT